MLTLPGLAGFVLSIGIAVDSYIVFFERLKDELNSGRTLRNSAQRSFEGAWRTVLAADTVVAAELDAELLETEH